MLQDYSLYASHLVAFCTCPFTNFSIWLKCNLVGKNLLYILVGSHGQSVHSIALNDQLTSHTILLQIMAQVFVFFPAILTQPLNDWDSLVENLCVIYNICDARSEL